MSVFNKTLTRADVEEIEASIGPFPSQAIETLLNQYGIDISAKNIPSSFPKYFALMAVLCSGLQEKKLLDFGCGLGVFVAQASRLGMKAEGIDIFTEYEGRCLDAAWCVSSCISPTGSPQLTQMDFLTEDVDREADFVTSFGMLEHIHGTQNRDLVVMKMMKAVMPGGYLILTCGPNKRFPFDLHHYGPKFLFYHCLPVKLRGIYLWIFGKKGQNQDPRWLNGMSVSEIKQSIVAHAGEAVEQIFPLWIELARTRVLKKTAIRRVASAIAYLLARMQAEPVIIIIARKKANAP
jgi:SAM-dependent methyltransferase